MSTDYVVENSRPFHRLFVTMMHNGKFVLGEYQADLDLPDLSLLKNSRIECGLS